MLMLSMLTLFEALTYNILNMIYFAVRAAAVVTFSLMYIKKLNMKL